ncbi:MAG: branched-chain amino acid ABC transporter permease [Desulfitobacteriaceae bacterium]|nr:branched-chain amino acid ABC transporter permease [Desulfitobacteriaceae bacterium]MDI6877852.1 branched-chain amino acid ABC transporter permease [Desulfitobacteriaceae bacterium]MDI6912747.1 branched-chain amino acid ABC transporter permease [Desulfitobacteriaceae bacterium]
MNKKVLRYLVFVLLAAVILSIPGVMPNNYYRGLANLSLIYVIVALGLNFIYGYTGYISFAQAAFFGIGAYTTALLGVDHHISFWLALPLSGIMASLFGVLIGIPSLKLTGHYLAMATIGFGIIVQMLMQNWTSFTHGATGIGNIPGISLGGFTISSASQYYYFLLFFVVLSILVTWSIEHSNLGRSFKAVREDEIAAATSGINLTFTKVFSFALSAFFAGIAGGLYASMSAYISPDTFSFDQSIVFFTMVLIGGAGTMLGPVIGAILLTFVPELLRFMKEYYMALFGIGIVLIMIFIPQGIVNVFAKDGQFAEWITAKRTAKVDSPQKDL